METNSACNQYLSENFDRFVAQLQEWLAIPSISTLPEYKKNVVEAADWARNKLIEIGFPEVKLIQTTGHPLVYAEWIGHSNQPTLLIYGHFDVQPVDPVEEWHSPPFEPTVRDGNIYCRGVSDDKGQIMLVLAALEAWARTEGMPPVNVKVILEGEEEAGGEAIASYVQKNHNLLRADAALICDTPMVDQNQPSIITGLRGILYTEIEVTGAKSDLHSGRYGGIAPNPLHALCLLISRLKGEDGAIQIPELNSAIPEPWPVEKKFLKEDPCNLETILKAEMGVEEMVGETDFPFLERVGLRPTLEVHGIRGGFTAEGAKTVIPAQALVKVSLRLPSNLEPDEVFLWFDKAVQRNMVPGYHLQLNMIGGGKGLHINPDNHYVKAAAAALETEYSVAPVFIRHGASIPIASLFDEVLKAPVVLMGFGLADDKIHAPNEKFSLKQFNKGMRAVADFIGKIAH